MRYRLAVVLLPDDMGEHLELALMPDFQITVTIFSDPAKAWHLILF
jgi:hypothetical protein